METTKTEKRLQRVTLAAALFCVVVSLLDGLNLAPGLGGKLMPLLIGILILYLLPLGQTINRTRHSTATVQHKVDDSLRNTVRQINKPDKKARSKPAPPPPRREIHWHGLTFRSQSEVKIAKQLDLCGVLFVSSCKIRLKTESHRQTREVDFLIYQDGQWGILEVDGPHHAHSAAADSWRDERFLEHGIRVSRYPANACYQTPKEVVADFLAQLHPPKPENTTAVDTKPDPSI